MSEIILQHLLEFKDTPNMYLRSPQLKLETKTHALWKYNQRHTLYLQTDRLHTELHIKFVFSYPRKVKLDTIELILSNDVMDATIRTFHHARFQASAAVSFKRQIFCEVVRRSLVVGNKCRPFVRNDNLHGPVKYN